MTQISQNSLHEETYLPQYTEKLSLLKRIKISIFGSTFLHYRKLEGWKAPLPFYAFLCKKHGIQVGYRLGWKKNLICPLCAKEKKICVNQGHKGLNIYQTKLYTHI